MFKWLREGGYTFDIAFTSVLKRAIKTLYCIQQELDLHWIPVHRHWRLNERMYGALQGKNKSETAIVCSNTDEPFGVLDSDVFNTILLSWLLIDDPRLIDESAK